MMRWRIGIGLAAAGLCGLVLAAPASEAAGPKSVASAPTPPTAKAAPKAAPKAASRPVTLPPWTADNIPAWAQSVQILKGDQGLLSRPDGKAARRGSAQRQVRLPLFGSRTGPGCGTPWYHVGPQAWVCGENLTLSVSAPIAHDKPAFEVTADGLPFRYFFTGRDGSLAYRKLEEVDIGEPVMSLDPGFAIAIVEERFVAGHRYGRTNRGLWVPMRDFGAAREFTFHGAELNVAPEPVTSGDPAKPAQNATTNQTIPVAWVLSTRAPLFAKRGAVFAATGKSLERFAEVRWLESIDRFGSGYARIDDNVWIRTRDVRHPTMATPPAEPDIANGARWIDIELASQTLVAYEGDRPVFATIVSTGKGKTKGHPFETPKGVHRIWVKLITTTMDNLENDYANRFWRIEDVPYVQFFHKGVGLHAAFWHRSFGKVRSHGCVNLAALDARRLFQWTGPNLPSGWTASLPTSVDQGTIVRVR